MDLTVECGKVGYHSGETGGVIPETFRIVRVLLDRLDDSLTGEVCAEMQVPVPDFKRKEAEHIAKTEGKGMISKYLVQEGVQFVSQNDLVELYLNNTWRPNMSITGADGLPQIYSAGNVLRPKTSVRISMRVCPALSAQQVEATMRSKLTTDVPYNAKVTLHGGHSGNGWSMKQLQPWFAEAIHKAGADFFDGKPTGSFGEGGSIPFLNELGTQFPDTQIIALGVLGPGSNAHGPNESINLAYTKKLTGSLTHIIAQCAQN
jgi:acetylornithine deacetylase/succinyl-diaminopimelate desuccinylase-like protein